jgi:hypothetical protein
MHQVGFITCIFRDARSTKHKTLNSVQSNGIQLLVKDSFSFVRLIPCGVTGFTGFLCVINGSHFVITLLAIGTGFGLTGLD